MWWSNKRERRNQEKEREIENARKRVEALNNLVPTWRCPFLDVQCKTDCVNWESAFYTTVPEVAVDLLGTYVHVNKPGCSYFQKYLSLPKNEVNT